MTRPEGTMHKARRVASRLLDGLTRLPLLHTRWSGEAERLRQPVHAATFVVLDLEMTGLVPRRDAIIAVAGVTMRGERILAGRCFEAKMRPHLPPEEDAIAVHGLLPDETATHDDPAESLAAFRTFCGDSVPAGWHVGLDAAFLDAAAQRHGVRPWPRRTLDVRGLHLALRHRLPARAAALATKDADLYAVARVFDIDVADAHDATGDAWLTALVLQRLLVHGDCGHMTLGDLFHLAATGLHELNGATAMTF